MYAVSCSLPAMGRCADCNRAMSHDNSITQERSEVWGDCCPVGLPYLSVFLAVYLNVFRSRDDDQMTYVMFMLLN